ncbi:MAG: hypothetical protein L7F78_10770 [Syntrophales bacterium LBB04]|nr:hypothetical protein [Syntrophales bacterium LBB04]
MENQTNSIQTHDGHTVTIDFFRPQDAPGIADLFREVYGEGYPIKVYYDPEALTLANARGDCCSIVARDETGRVVGVTHAVRSAPFEGLYESAAGLVLKTYRSQGISKRLQRFLLYQWAASRPQVAGLFGEPVCNHLQLQKTWYDLGAVETGLEVALMPAEAYDLEKRGQGRVACLTAYLPVKDRPHRVYLPQAYTEPLTFLYSGPLEGRSLAPSVEPLPVDRPTLVEKTVFDFASVVRVVFQEIGFDLETCLDSLERERKNLGLRVVQISLKLGCPWIGAAVDVLRTKGFFLGGILPRWFDEDGLLMQKLFCPPDWEEIRLYSDRAKEILRLIREDRDRAIALESSVGL